MSISLIMFLGFVALTLLITFWAAKKNTGASAYFAAGRSITGWQNGLAVAGDYMSAASFLGISGMICFSGYDGFMYSVGFLVAYITVLLIVASVVVIMQTLIASAVPPHASAPRCARCPGNTADPSPRGARRTPEA